MIKLFALAILIRLLVMPFYFHPDIKTYNFQASFLGSGVFNIYTYLADNKPNLKIKEEFVYFPLTYFFLGAYQIIASPFLGTEFNNWLSDASEQARQAVGAFKYIFILKLPYLLIDLMIPFLLMKFFDDAKRKRQVLILWLFNPISIAIIYLFSNIDIIPVALSFLSLLLFRKDRILLSGLALGLAVGFKAYPLLFLPFMLIFARNRRDGIKMFLMSIATLMVTIAPFWSDAFLKSTLISGLTTRIAYPAISIGFGETLMVAVLSLTTLFIIVFTTEKKRAENLWIYLFLALLIMFSSIHYHIQWLLWIMPFLIIFAVFQKGILSRLGWIWIYLAFLLPLLYEDKAMTVSLLSVISPIYNLLPTPFLIFQKFYDPFLAQSLIHSILFGISLGLIFKTYKLLKT